LKFGHLERKVEPLKGQVLGGPDDLLDDAPTPASTIAASARLVQGLRTETDQDDGHARQRKYPEVEVLLPAGVADWSHPSGTFTLLGDAVHATLP
jgi:hypothetical protein